MALNGSTVIAIDRIVEILRLDGQLNAIGGDRLKDALYELVERIKDE